MSTLTGTKIKDTYPGLIKTTDNAALGATEKNIEDGAGNASTLSMGTASASFTGTLDLSGATVTGLPSGGGLEPVQLSGTSQTLDLGQYNFFDGGTLTGDTTLTFSNAPTEARFQYSFTVAGAPYKIEDATWSSKSVAMQPKGVTAATLTGFNADGTVAFYLRTDTSGDRLYAYPLTTAYDISTTGSVINNVLLDDGTDNQVGPGIYFKSDGSAFYTGGAENDSVYEWSMTTAFDLSTASYSGNSFSLSGITPTPRAVYFKPDGTRMYVLGSTFDKVNSWTLSTPWDVTSATYDNKSLNVISQDNVPVGLAFNADGTKLIMSGSQNNSFYEYDLSTAWDIATASYNNNFFDNNGTITSTLLGLVFDATGQFFYASDKTTSTVYQYNTGSAAVTYPSSVQNAPTKVFLPGDVVTQTFYTLDTGTNVYFEDEPQPAGSQPGLVAGTGADSIAVSSAVVSNPSIASASGAIAIGDNAYAQAAKNITIGQNSQSNGSDIINIGDNNDMSAASDATVLIRPGGGTGIAYRGSSVAIGVNTYPGANAVAIGRNAQGGQNDANVVIGANAYATGDGVAIGENTDAIGVKSIAIGSGAQATGTGSDGKIAIGNANVSKNKGIGIGVNGVSVASEGIALGDNVDIASGSDRTIAIGNAINIGSGAADSIVMGTSADSSAQKGIALGYDAHVTATEGIALGYQVTAATDFTVTLKRLQMLDYASLNYADDAAAATGGIPLGGVYHTDGALKVRIA